MDQRFFAIKNPWRDGYRTSPPAIARPALADLLYGVERRMVTLLLGPRRAGKTTLLLALVDYLLRERGVFPRNVFYFDLDTLDCKDILASPSSLIDYIGMPAAETVYVLIDEVQRLESPGLFLKGVHDLGLNLRVVVSGSSSLELRAQVRENLTGRRHTTLLSPLGPLEIAPAASISTHDLERWLQYGGFPEVWLEPSVPSKQRMLLEYQRSYLERDVTGTLRIERREVFENLMRVLASQTGSLVNLNEIAATLGASRDTITRYVEVLQETFVVRRLPPFSRNLRHEISKMPKVFFSDLGWRNLLSGGFAPLAQRSDRGALLENAIEIMLRQSNPGASMFFWRTDNKAEVDFIVEEGSRLEAFEVKHSVLRRPVVSRGLRNFISAYHPSRVVVLHGGGTMERKVGEELVEFRPWTDLVS